ncbi:phosphate ABC transporter substrate-binding protein PstS [Nesterenkonia halobia]|uniref:phosphate ABC transporter substrate-binding protein PstS n=1 Tax=Nesterenkonia halobia TaxID=37922 RepID=UPI0031D8DA15
MKADRLGRAAAVLGVASLALVACGESNNPDGGSESGGDGGSVDVQGTLQGGGASSQESAMTAWTQGFGSQAQGAQVNYAPVGSGGGREGFLGGEYSFAGSDAAMSDEEWEDSKEVCGPDGAFHVPAYISPVAVAFNVEGIDDTLNLDAETLAQIFAGEIDSWDDEAIAEHNPDLELPDTPITVVHRADDSGTTENFTDYLSVAAEDAWTWGAVETWPEDITAESAQQTSGVVDLTTSTDGAITYADASQVGDLNSVAVQVGEEYVEYSAEAAANAVASSEPVEGQAPNNQAVELKRDTTESGAYPIVLVSYHIFCNEYSDQETVDLVKAFEEYVISEEGQAAAEEAAGSAPLSEDLRTQAQEALEQITVAE